MEQHNQPHRTSNCAGLMVTAEGKNPRRLENCKNIIFWRRNQNGFLFKIFVRQWPQNTSNRSLTRRHESKIQSKRFLVVAYDMAILTNKRRAKYKSWLKATKTVHCTNIPCSQLEEDTTRESISSTIPLISEFQRKTSFNVLSSLLWCYFVWEVYTIILQSEN